MGNDLILRGLGERGKNKAQRTYIQGWRGYKAKGRAGGVWAAARKVFERWIDATRGRIADGLRYFNRLLSGIRMGCGKVFESTLISWLQAEFTGGRPLLDRADEENMISKSSSIPEMSHLLSQVRRMLDS